MARSEDISANESPLFRTEIDKGLTSWPASHFELPPRRLRPRDAAYRAYRGPLGIVELGLRFGREHSAPRFGSQNGYSEPNPGLRRSERGGSCSGMGKGYVSRAGRQTIYPSGFVHGL